MENKCACQMLDLLFISVKVKEDEECISFEAKQLVPVGLLQPAPATFYDYYEPGKTVVLSFSLYTNTYAISFIE